MTEVQPQQTEQLWTPGQEIEWSQMLETALKVPGSLGATYNRFYEYSLGNQILLFMQGVQEPVNTYNRWAAMGRQVLKGSKAKTIMRPLMAKRENDAGEQETFVRGFKYINCLFTASETTGDELPPVEPRIWDKTKALGALAITEAPFQLLDGNTQGYSYERKVAISPVAAFPVKTLMHEIAHIVHGHTSPEQIGEYKTHRGIKEFEAESVAYLAMNELDLTEHADMSESRAYIQHWLGFQEPPETSIRRVFSVTDKILKAGFVEREVLGMGEPQS